MKNILRVAIILSLVLLSIGLLANNTALAADPYTTWTDQGIIYTAPNIAPDNGNAYYPSVIFDHNGFGQGTSSPNYKMWYSNGDGAAFLLTSSNGISWSASTPLSGLGNNAHHVQVLYDVNHFGQGPGGPSYRIWYWNINSNLYSISSIYTAQSVDGINWTSASPLSQDPLAQLVTGTWPGWNSGSYGPVYLFYQSAKANTGTDPWNYEYVMYYDGTTGAMEETGLAYSADGLYWKAYSGNPVLAATPLAWDSNDAVYGTIYHDSQGFHYWYSGGVSSPNDGIGYAFSTDGENWTKDPNSPFFNINDGKIYRNERTYTPSIINDGTGFLKMYYTAKSIGGPKKIGLAYLTEPPPIEVETATHTGMATFTSNACAFNNLAAVAEGTLPATGKPNLDFKHGFFSFNTTVCVPGDTVTVTITLPLAVSASAQYWKYGPTSDNNTDHWYQIPMTGAGTSVITITLKDGGLGDDDLTANGVIIDQGGPGDPPPATPPPTPMSLSVGGIAQFPADSSGSSSTPYAIIIGGSIAALAALAVGVWFARRRWQGRCS